VSRLSNPVGLWSDHVVDDMDQIRIPITQLRPGVTLPGYQSAGAAGMRIAQLVVARVAHFAWNPADELPDTDRGEGGFGHTGH
jgi:dUTPase